MAFTQLRESLFQGRLPEIRKQISRAKLQDPEVKQVTVRRKLFRLNPFELGKLRAEGHKVVVTPTEYQITLPIVWIFPAPPAEPEEAPAG